MALGKEEMIKTLCPACWPSLQSQSSPGGEPAESREDDGSGTQRDKSPHSLLPSGHIHADDVLKILKAFLRDFDKLR